MGNPNTRPDFEDRARGIVRLINTHQASTKSIAALLEEWHEVSYHQGLIYGGFEEQDNNKEYAAQFEGCACCSGKTIDPLDGVND